MDETLVVEGTVEVEEGFGPFLHTAPKNEDGFMGYSGEGLLTQFLGKRVRVTIEVIAEEGEVADADP